MKTVILSVKAEIGEEIKCAALELRARVIGLYTTIHGTTYEVAYFHNGERKTAYLHPDEFIVLRD